MSSNGTPDGGPVSKYETEEGLREVALFLRGRNGMPLRPAIEMDKRVDYFKGENNRDVVNSLCMAMHVLSFECRKKERTPPCRLVVFDLPVYGSR